MQTTLFGSFQYLIVGLGAFISHWCKSIHFSRVISLKNNLVRISSRSLYSSD